MLNLLITHNHLYLITAIVTFLKSTVPKISSTNHPLLKKILNKLININLHKFLTILSKLTASQKPANLLLLSNLKTNSETSTSTLNLIPINTQKVIPIINLSLILHSTAEKIHLT